MLGLREGLLLAYSPSSRWTVLLLYPFFLDSAKVNFASSEL